MPEQDDPKPDNRGQTPLRVYLRVCAPVSALREAGATLSA
jgi:hypothetical protein